MIYTDGEKYYFVGKEMTGDYQFTGYYAIGFIYTFGDYHCKDTHFLQLTKYKSLEKAEFMLKILAKKNNWEVIKNGKSSSIGI